MCTNHSLANQTFLVRQRYYAKPPLHSTTGSARYQNLTVYGRSAGGVFLGPVQKSITLESTRRHTSDTNTPTQKLLLERTKLPSVFAVKKLLFLVFRFFVVFFGRWWSYVVYISSNM